MSKQKLIVMLEMQDAMNSRVHEHWREQRFPWYRAIWLESAELMDHIGWKWWKKQEPDLDQVVLELVDIWHFGLSLLLQNSSDYERLAHKIDGQLKCVEYCSDFRVDLERFVITVLSEQRFDISGFARMMSDVGLNIDELYRKYVGKNVLNFFRQDHGYAEGTYKKVWQGKEDNEHLSEIVRSLNTDDSAFRDNLYVALAKRYQAATEYA